METKHTKGEWTYSKYTPCDLGVYSLEGNGHDIALVRGEGPEAEANAKVIAAAPALLNALKEVDGLRQHEDAKIHYSRLGDIHYLLLGGSVTVLNS